MRIQKKLTAHVAVVIAAVALTGASAFAESRPSDGTRVRSEARREGKVVERRDRSTARNSDVSRNASVERRATQRRNEAPATRRDTSDRNRRESATTRGGRVETRETVRRGNDVRQYDRRESTRQSGSRVDVYGGRQDSHRNDGWRGSDTRHAPSYRGSQHRQPYYAHGRVTRVIPYSGGYRLWVAGAPYPFFVSSDYYHRHRPRVGISIRLGGYYNPLGYYDYYDGYSNRAYSTGVLRGTVESVDYRRDTFVIRNEASGSFVTVAMYDRRGDVRPGDYVELTGDWTRAGVFHARYVDLLDNDYRR